MLKCLVLSIVAAAAPAVAGTIDTGTLRSFLAVQLPRWGTQLTGVNQAGNPYSIQISNILGSVEIGNERCLGATGSPIPMSCTWDFPGTYTADTSFGNLLTGQIVWDGVTYDLTGSSPYEASFTYSVVADPVTVMSVIQSGVHTWNFPQASALVSIAFAMRQGNTTLISETLSSAFVYSGGASQPPVGGEWTHSIFYTAVPEPQSFGLCATGAALFLATYRRRRKLSARLLRQDQG